MQHSHPRRQRRWIAAAGASLAMLRVLSAEAAPAQTAVVVSSGAQAAAQGAGLVGELALRYPLGERWGMQVLGRAGWLHERGPCDGAAGGAGCGDHGQLALLVGPSWSAAWGERRMHASALLAHVHHTAVEQWRARPLANAAGDSSGAVQHRSGAELRLGITSAPWPVSPAWDLAVEVDLSASALPSSRLLSWGVGAQLGVVLLRRPSR